MPRQIRGQQLAFLKELTRRCLRIRAVLLSLASDVDLQFAHFTLVPEMARAGKDHGHITLISCGNHLTFFQVSGELGILAGFPSTNTFVSVKIPFESILKYRGGVIFSGCVTTIS